MNNNVYNNSLRKEIVDKADIVSIVSQYVSLEKKGANYIGLCPFHEDKNPSMSVSPTKKVFKCFSCNTGGDVITFVSKIKNIPVRDAMRLVGETVGVKVQVSKKEIERQKNAKYYNIMTDASNFYHFYLKNSKEALEAINYLNRRGLSKDIINEFQIGLSGENDELFKVLSGKQYLEVDMSELGLIHSYGNTYHDYFKNRIIFPLKDLDGNICGFSGRKYKENDNESKYKNSSENIIFKKGQILYNYSDCFNLIKQSNHVYLFEGFMDVIAACRAGIKNSIASMGTALTNNQIEAIKRITNNVIICYDSDEPGIMATLRAIDMLNAYDMNVKVVTIPDGKDPDEFLKKNGEDGLQKCLLNNQTSAMGFIYNLYSKTTLFDDVNSKESFKNTIFKNLCKFKSNALIETFLNKLANDLNVSFESVKNDYLLFSKNVDNFKKNDVKYEVVDEEAITSEVKIINKFEFNKYLLAEKRLIRAAFENKNDCFYIESALGYSFVEKNNRNLLFKLRVYYQKHELMNYDDFKSLLDDEKLINIIDEIIKNEEVPEKKIIDEYIDLLGEYLSAKIVRDIIEDEDRNIENLKTLAENKKRTIKLQRKGVK